MNLIHDVRSVRRYVVHMAANSRLPPSPISEQILHVRASLYRAVESLQSSLEYGNDVLAVPDAVAIVAEQITELKRLLVLLEHDEAASGSATIQPSRALSSRAPAA
jgi:hypothetical protein